MNDLSLIIQGDKSIWIHIERGDLSLEDTRKLVLRLNHLIKQGKETEELFKSEGFL